MHVLTLMLLTISPQEAIDGAEIGTADQYVAFESHGPYKAERTDKKAGNTTMTGKWELKDDTLEVLGIITRRPEDDLTTIFPADLHASAGARAAPNQETGEWLGEPERHGSQAPLDVIATLFIRPDPKPTRVTAVHVASATAHRVALDGLSLEGRPFGRPVGQGACLEV